MKELSLQQKKKFFSRPDFYSTKLKLNYSPELWAETFIDIDAKETIVNLGFETNLGDDFQIAVIDIFEVIQGKKIQEAIKILEDYENKNFEHLKAYLLVSQSILNFLSPINLKTPKEIICKCYGVNLTSLNKVLSEGANFQEMLLKTNAGTNCRSCFPDLIENFLKYHQDARRYRNIPNSEWIVRCDQLLSQFMQSTPIDFQGQKFEIEGFKAGILFGNFSHPQNFSAFRFGFESFLQKELKEKIIVWS